MIVTDSDEARPGPRSRGAGSGIVREQAQFPRTEHGLAPPGHTQLGEHLSQVIAHTVHRQSELRGNLLVPLAFRPPKHVLLALAQHRLTTDAKLQLAVWEELRAQQYGPSVWQIRRSLTECRMPATSALAKFVGAAAGVLTRDLFAEEDNSGIWFDDPALLRKLALDRLETAAEELRTKWSWAEARVEVGRNARRHAPAVALAVALAARIDIPVNVGHAQLIGMVLWKIQPVRAIPAPVSEQ